MRGATQMQWQAASFAAFVGRLPTWADTVANLSNARALFRD